MKFKNSNLRYFLTGGIGYAIGTLAGVLVIYLVSRLGLARWLFSLIDQNQSLLQLLGVLLIVGLLLTLGGAVIGGIGGWSLARIMNTSHPARLIASSAMAYGLSTGLLVLVFLLLISFIGLYNNFSTGRIEQYGIIVGLFGLLFGLLAGILQALMSVSTVWIYGWWRHPWLAGAPRKPNRRIPNIPHPYRSDLTNWSVVTLLPGRRCAGFCVWPSSSPRRT
jgi:hypothetical protein